MAYPYLIDASNVLCFGTAAQRVGPFQYGSALYVLIIDSATSAMEVWRSTDDGSTWAEQDSANKPASVSIALFNTIVVNNTLYSGYFNSSTFEIHICRFSMAQNVWLADIENGPGSTFENSAYYPFGDQMAMLSDGRLRYVYPGRRGSVGDQTVFCRTYDTLNDTWSSDITIGTSEQCTVAGLLLGPSDRIHVFVQAGGTLKHQSVSADDSTGTLQTITSSLEESSSSSSGLCNGPGECWFDGTNWKLALPYSDTSEDLKMAIATAAVDPTWSTETIESSNEPRVTTNNWPMMFLSIYAGILYAFWLSPDADPSSIYYASRDSGGTWSSATQHRTYGDITALLGNSITDGIGMVFNGGTNGIWSANYDFLDLSGGVGATPTGALYGFLG